MSTIQDQLSEMRERRKIWAECSAVWSGFTGFVLYMLDLSVKTHGSDPLAYVEEIGAVALLSGLWGATLYFHTGYRRLKRKLTAGENVVQNPALLSYSSS